MPFFPNGCRSLLDGWRASKFVGWHTAQPSAGARRPGAECDERAGCSPCGRGVDAQNEPAARCDAAGSHLRRAN